MSVWVASLVLAPQRLFRARALTSQAATVRDLSSSYAMPRTGANVQLLLDACRLEDRAGEALSQMKGRKVLGLDINTSSTGYAVLQVGQGASVNLLDWGRVCLKDTADVLEGGGLVQDQLRALCLKHGSKQDGHCWDVGVEDFAKSYTPGRFNTRGLFKLAQLSGIVKFSCMNAFGCTPWEWHPTSARAFFGLRKSQEPGGDDVKKVVFDFVTSREASASKEYSWEWLASGELSKENYDVTDAYLIATYTLAQGILRHIRDDQEMLDSFLRAYSDCHEERMHRAEERFMGKASSEAEATSRKFNLAAARRTYRAAERKKIVGLFGEAVDAWVKLHFLV
jgi:hypothetical protein